MEGRKLIDQAGHGPPGMERITPQIAELIGEAILHDFASVGRGGVEVRTVENGIMVTGIDSVSVPEENPPYCHDVHTRILWEGSYEDAFSLIDFKLAHRRDDDAPLTPEDVEMSEVLSRGNPEGRA